MKGPIRLKKESNRAELACGTSDTVSGYRQAKQSVEIISRFVLARDLQSDRKLSSYLKTKEEWLSN